MLLKRIGGFIKRNWWFLCNKYKFGYLGKGTFIVNPLKLQGVKKIFVGANVNIGYKSWLAAVPHTGFKRECSVVIEDGVSIGNFAHIYATKKIHIQKDVLIADKVYISDNTHGFDNVNIPIIKQPVLQKKEVLIGEGSWVGEGVCIIGASIGKNTVIGANAIIVKDIPSYCVAVGAPAKIIRRYCFDENRWKKTDNNGNFID